MSKGTLVLIRSFYLSSLLKALSFGLAFLLGLGASLWSQDSPALHASQGQKAQQNAFERALGLLEKNSNEARSHLRQVQISSSHVLTALAAFSRCSPVILALASERSELPLRRAILLQRAIPYLEKITHHVRLEQENLQQTSQVGQKAEAILCNSSIPFSKKREKLLALLQKSEISLPQPLQAALDEHIRDLAQQAHSIEALVRELDKEVQSENPLAQRKTQTIALPAQGKIRRTFGDSIPGAGPSKGILLETLPQAPVVAPTSGRVVFSGPFRSYGTVIIIDHGEALHSLLAGLLRAEVRVGDEVSAKKLLGYMPKRKPALLTFELRKDGKPVNPESFLSLGSSKGGNNE